MLNQRTPLPLRFSQKKISNTAITRKPFGYLCFKKYLLKQVSSYEKNIPTTHFNATHI
jgi:hypothetical protein